MKTLAALAAAALLAPAGAALAVPVAGPPTAPPAGCAALADGAAETLVPYRRSSCDVATETAPEADQPPVVLARYRRG